MLRVSWVQPEDLVAHELVASTDEGRDVSGIAGRWVAAGGSLSAAVSGATPEPATEALRALARDLLAELDLLPLPAQLARTEPDDLPGIFAAAPAVTVAPGGDALLDSVHGAWLGRAAGCLVGKPVEKISRRGIREILDSTGRWPLDRYFTAAGLAADVAAEYPWNRRSRHTSLEENINGMPEDDDLNFPLIALGLLESVGHDFTTDDVALSWLTNLPGGRVFTAERIVYRNLLAGSEPSIVGQVQNPFRDWIGAQIRSDVYGWTNPADPRAAAALAYRDAWLSHRRGGIYGAMFVAAACSAAVVGSSMDDILDAGLSVIPSASRYAAAITRGRDLARGPLSSEEAIDAIYTDYGHLHWVHATNNAALMSFALQRSAGDFESAITTAVVGGWDTDSNGATVGSICGAMSGASGLAPKWVDPLQNRLATSIPGFDGIGFDELARRTVAVSR
jgi:ADP-ribosylglycohydrolase